MNWRASATGPASDRSSNSGGERDPPARRNAERADKDGKWREETGGRPPSGAKSKKKNGPTLLAQWTISAGELLSRTSVLIGRPNDLSKGSSCSE